MTAGIVMPSGAFEFRNGLDFRGDVELAFGANLCAARTTRIANHTNVGGLDENERHALYCSRVQSPIKLHNARMHA